MNQKKLIASPARRGQRSWPIQGVIAGLLLVVSGSLATADSLHLRGGETLVGRIIEEEPDQVIFQSHNLGQLKIPRERIERIVREPAAAQAPGTVSPVMTNVPTSANLTNAVFYPWQTRFPAELKYDWIELKSGEWLKGHMKSLQDEKLEFDSEEMDLREFDWEDIRTLHAPGLNSIWYGDKQILTGPVFITTNQVQILGATTNTFERYQLIAVTPTGKKELDNWSGKVSVGLTLRSGNTKQVDYNAHLAIDRRTPSTHLSLDYLGNVGRVDDVETINNNRVTLEFDYFLSRRLFLVLPYAEYYRDPLQNLDHRATAGVGVGYDIVHNRRVEWNITAGPAYQRNWYTSVEAGEDRSPDAFALVLGTALELELTKRLDFTAELRSHITSRETGQTTYHGVATLEFEIHKRLDLDVSFIWDRLTNPQPDASGDTPAKDDFRLILGLGLDF